VQDAIAGIILGPGEWPEWYAKWAALQPDQFTKAFQCLMHRDDITSRLSEISSPALIIHGTADIAISMDKAESLRDGLAGPVTLVPVEGGPHASNMTHPVEVNAAILQFLSSL
jgi:pimeloyl-ACP methyl ester carboxylesterase